VLTPEELMWVWTALDGFPGIFGPLFKVLLLTGQRRGEVAGMRWNELRNLGTDEAVWDLPASRTKNGQPHLVPLAPEVQAILMAQPRKGELVFSTTSTTALSGFSNAKRQLDELIAELRREAGLAPLPPWTLHDLRRTMVTMMNERLHIQPHVVEAVVNHLNGAAKQGVAGVYNRALYLNDRGKALSAWAACVNSLAAMRSTSSSAKAAA
jgi:integrase